MELNEAKKLAKGMSRRYESMLEKIAEIAQHKQENPAQWPVSNSQEDCFRDVIESSFYMSHPVIQAQMLEQVIMDTAMSRKNFDKYIKAYRTLMQGYAAMVKDVEEQQK